MQGMKMNHVGVNVFHEWNKIPHCEVSNRLWLVGKVMKFGAHSAVILLINCEVLPSKLPWQW